MYNTYYLKFASQEEWDAKAEEVGYRYENLETGEVYYSVRPGAIDVVGTVYNDNAVFNEDGEVDTPPTAKDGWHVNIRVRSKSISTGEKTSEDVSLPEALNTYIVNPQTPSRVFA